MQKLSIVLAAVFGLLAMHFALVLFGPCLGPIIFFITAQLITGFRVRVSMTRVSDIVDAMGVPDGKWLVCFHNFTPRGCQTTEKQVVGPFSEVISIIGLRTPEEIERIRTMIFDSLEGGYDWVTLYNPIGIPKEEEASACSTITIQYQPLPRQSD